MKTSEKIFQENSYTTELQAEVISCTQKDDYYEVILNKTIFYPHMSGGQPKDEGTINNIKVFDVQEQGDTIIHKLKEPVEGNVSLSIDFNTRFDYMQQHTGQHILSYAFDELFNGRTVGFHLSDNYTTIDLNITLTEDMIEQAEFLSNKIVFENKGIFAKVYTYEEAIELGLRKTPIDLDYLRIISIDGYDKVACGGTHVNKTGEIGLIKIIKTEKHKDGTRVEFLCGKRALKDYMTKHKRITELSYMLTCRDDMVVDNFNKVLNENKKLKKDFNTLNTLLNGYKAKEFKEDAINKDGVNYIFSKTDNDVKDLRSICSIITEGESYVTVLVSEGENACNLVIGQSKNLKYNLKNIFEKCKQIINGKGGGNNFLLQCTGDMLKGDECLAVSKDILLNSNIIV